MERTNTFLPLDNDTMFKLFFMNNEDLLKNLLKVSLCFTDSDFFSIDIQPPIFATEDLDFHVSMLDLDITTSTDERIIVKLQFRKAESPVQRIISTNGAELFFYAQESAKKEIKGVYELIFAECDLYPPSDNHIREYYFTQENGEEGNVSPWLPQVYAVDLNKLPEVLTEEVEKWAAFLKVKTLAELTAFTEAYPEFEQEAQLLKALSDELNAKTNEEIAKLKASIDPYFNPHTFS